MNKKSLLLNFYEIEILISSESSALLDRLALDFSFFSKAGHCSSSIKIDAYLESPNIKNIEGTRLFKTSKVEVFEKSYLRTSVYGLEGISIWNQLEDSVSIYSNEINLLHELVYLFVLSRVGKLLDLRGLHRIHASCLTIEDTLILGMMSSGVGKSTLAAFLLEQPGISVYSDDSPLISSSGDVKPFPLRFGFESNGMLPESWKEKKSYSLKRRNYGVKTLFSLRDLNVSIGREYKQKFILMGKRSADAAPLVVKVPRYYALKHIFKEGVIGIGLPILLEYFWQSGFNDFLKKSKILFSRIKAFAVLLIKSEVYQMYLTNDPELNAEFLVRWCKTRKGT